MPAWTRPDIASRGLVASSRVARRNDRLSLVPLSPEIIELATGAHTRPATGNGRDLPGYGPHDAR